MSPGLVRGWLCWTCEPENGLALFKGRSLLRHLRHEVRQFDFLPSQVQAGVDR